MEEKEHIQIKHSRQVHAGTAVNVYVNEMHVPGGQTEYWDHVEHRFGAAAVVPLLEDQRILLVHQYRPSIGRFSWEIPAGAREGGTEDPYVCAMRELREETGFEADELEHLMTFASAPAYCSEKIEIYLAKSIRPVGAQILDNAEDISVKAWDIHTLLAMIDEGTLQDGKTISGILAAHLRLQA